MTVSRLSHARTSRPSALSALLHLPGLLLARAELARSRRGLARLDDHLLRDIGIAHAEAQKEAARGGWDAPSHWKG